MSAALEQLFFPTMLGMSLGWELATRRFSCHITTQLNPMR